MSDKIHHQLIPALWTLQRRTVAKFTPRACKDEIKGPYIEFVYSDDNKFKSMNY